MPTGLYSTYQYQLWVDDLEATDIWLGLCGSDPISAANPLSVEFSGGGYSRPKCVWSRASATLLRVGVPVSWQGLPVGSQIAAVAGFDAATNGRVRFAVYEPDGIQVGPGGTYALPVNSIYVGLGSP